MPKDLQLNVKVPRSAMSVKVRIINARCIRRRLWLAVIAAKILSWMLAAPIYLCGFKVELELGADMNNLSWDIEW